MLRTLLACLFTALLATTAVGQGKAKNEFLVPIPEKLERATTTDANGVVQWADYKAEPCVNCKGRKTMVCRHCERFEKGDHADCPECQETKEAPCRICAGTGEMPDILTTAPCPTCFGASVTPCLICNGAGRFPVAGGGDRMQKCGCCDGVGAYKCATCNGKRKVETPALRPSVGEAKVADLKKAQEALAEVAAALAAFESTGDGRKDSKAFDKLVGPGERYFPPLKRARKHFDDATKKQAKGAVWTHYGEAVKNNLAMAKQALDYYVKHQIRLLELSLARAEQNAKK